jgi:hypothetical protein
MGKTQFIPNGSSQGIPVNSRDEILAILKEKAGAIVEIAIESKNGELLVLARMKGDASWIGVGKVNNMI